jgi:hypothetical protein
MIPGADNRAAAALGDAARAVETCGWQRVDDDEPDRQEIILTDGGELEIVIRHAREGRSSAARER